MIIQDSAIIKAIEWIGFDDKISKGRIKYEYTNIRNETLNFKKIYRK